MRILHTADWHLGKIFHEYSMIEDQRYVLNQILEIIKTAQEEKNPFSALLVSGDIYDRAVPSSEASNLLSDFLTQATESFPELHIFMISGNHDSAERLSFASSFLEKHKIHLTTNTKNFLEPIILEDVNSDLSNSKNQKVAFYQLPFLHPGSIKFSEQQNATLNASSFSQSKNSALNAEDQVKSKTATLSKKNSAQSKNQNQSEIAPLNIEKICRTQEELFREATNQIIKNHQKKFCKIPLVLNAHLFTLGSIQASSERSNIGTAEQVDVSLFKDFTYGAFGHIHKFQACDKAHKCFYSGSLLPYNFDDSTESGILDVEINSYDEVPKVKRILFNPLHKIATLEGKFDNFVNPQKNQNFVKENKNDFLQIILTDENEIREPFLRLKEIFPNLLLLSLKNRTSSAANLSIQKRKEAIKSKDFSQIFTQFLTDIYGQNYDQSSELVKNEKEIFEQEASKIEKPSD